MLLKCRNIKLFVHPLVVVALALTLSRACAFELLVSCSTDGTVQRFSEAGSSLGSFTFGSLPGLPADVELGGTTGDLYLVSWGASGVLRYNGAAGAYLGTTTTPLSSAVGAAFDSARRLYVSHRAQGSDWGVVTRYSDPTNLGSGTTFVASGDHGLLCPYDIECGPDGRIYILAQDGSSGNASSIYVYDTNGAFICKRATGTGYYYGIAFKDNYLYFSDLYANNVWRIPYAQVQTGTLEKFVSNGGGAEAGGFLGIEFGPDGNLYVVSMTNNRILRYNGTTGAYMGVFANVTAPRFITFLRPPADDLGVRPGTRLFVTKCYGAPTGANFQQVADAGFTLAMKDTDQMDPINNSGSLNYMRTYFQLAANAGLDAGTWQGGMAPASYGETARVNYDGTVSQFATPISATAWRRMGDAIVQWVNLSLVYPNYKLLVLDYEVQNYTAYGGDFSESYDNIAFIGFFSTTGRPVPSPLPAAGARRTYLSQRGLLNEYINFQWNIVLREMRNIRQRVDAVNPKFQFGVYFGGSLLSAVLQGLATEAAPVVDFDANTYGRGPWDPAWDHTPEGGWGAAANRPDRLGLKWSLNVSSPGTRLARLRPYPAIYLAGHWAQVPGPADGSQYKFLARQAFNSAAYCDGYWIWTDGWTPNGWTSLTDWISTAMPYFRESNIALDGGDYAWASRQPDSIPDPNASIPRLLFTLSGETARIWNPVTGQNTGTRSPAGLSFSSTVVGDVDAIPGDEVVTLRDGVIRIWDPRTGSELLRFAVGTDQSAIAIAPPGPNTSAWELLVSTGSLGTIKRFSQSGSYIDTFASGGAMQAAVDVGYARDGNLYATDFTAGRLHKFNGATGAYIGSFGSGLKDAIGLAVDTGGNLYVSHRSPGTDSGMVTRFTPAGSSSIFIPAADHGLYAPYDTEFGPDGNLYIGGEDASNGNAPTIYVYSSSGSFIRKRAAGSHIRSLAFDDTYVYWSDYWPGHVYRLALSQFATGTPQSFLTGYSTMVTAGIKFGPDGKLYVGNAANNTVVRFNGATGAFDTVVATDIMNPSYLAFKTLRSIDEARKAADGISVELYDAIVTAQFYTGAATPFSFAVESVDRLNGIRVLSNKKVSPGDRVAVTGTAATVSGERVIDAQSGSVTINTTGGNGPGPLLMAHRSVGGGIYVAQGAVADDAVADPIKMSAGVNSVGLLATITGRVTASNQTGDWSGYFYVDDGSGLRDGSGNIGIKCRPAPNSAGAPLAVPGVNAYVSVTGVVGVQKNGDGVNVRYLWTRSIDPHDPNP